jgi:hypothetical protein
LFIWLLDVGKGMERSLLRLNRRQASPGNLPGLS